MSTVGSAVNYKKIGKNRYQLERTPQMKVDAIFYANDKILPLITRDRSLEQLQQTAELPHLESPVLGMPDMHEGYGIPVGGVMVSNKLVSAGCVGMDINCGVRLLKCGVDFDKKIFDERGLREVVGLIEKVIPMGLGRRRRERLKGISFEKTIIDGARHLVDEGYGEEDDLIYTEEQGRINGANPDKFSKRAKSRAKRQIGTLGSGNHFLELQRVDKIYDEKASKTFGLHKGLICFMIHSGSRALGHQSCIDFTNRFFEENEDRHPELVPTKNLASALVVSDEGRDYLSVMNGAINFAFANRQMMTYQFREVFTKYMSKKGIDVKVQVIYGIAHNSAKWEDHRSKKVLVHRKGATRALPPGHVDNPPAYKDIGHPVFVPGSMGTASYVLIGTEKAAETYFSVNHGAGRAMSRTEARRTISKKDFEKQMEGIVFNKPYRIVADEAPAAYKVVEEVVDTLEEIGITKRVAKLKPLAVLKGD